MRLGSISLVLMFVASLATPVRAEFFGTTFQAGRIVEESGAAAIWVPTDNIQIDNGYLSYVGWRCLSGYPAVVLYDVTTNEILSTDFMGRTDMEWQQIHFRAPLPITIASGDKLLIALTQGRGCRAGGGSVGFDYHIMPTGARSQ